MSKFGSKEAILTAINAHFQNMQSGQLTADDMESLVELTRELHERALILRYKTYEEKIFGVREQSVETTAVETDTVHQEAPLAEEVISFERVEEEILSHEMELETQEPVFDFDLFEKAENQASSLTHESAVEPEIALFPLEATTEIQADNVENSIPFEKVEEEILRHEVEIQQALSSDELIPTENNHPTFEEHVFEATPEITYETPAEPQAPVQAASFVEQTVVSENPTPNQNENTEIFNQLLNNDHSIGSRIKLHSLVGSFGLNDKLQCIRELFHGSSEAFNNALETIDQQSDFQSAKRVMATYAKQYNWNFESNLTAQFVQKVERRFL
ncbi:MAG: hypothetical protein E6Q37_10230 [Crocinitomicaceae bacterium]|nr:MAG: hypothetical protein E6Q37_10230 [Crocinitomicaceae bacterium]